MSYSRTTSTTKTYTYSDVENVVRRLSADFYMIAESTGALSRLEVAEYVHDICVFAIEEVLDFVDVTLIDGGQEIRATRFTVNSDMSFTNERPGGVFWPRRQFASIRVIINYKNGVSDAQIKRINKDCKINWVSTNEDFSHSSLNSNIGRQYSSNGYGMTRTDWK